MKLTFLGGADEVGASGILIETAGSRVLVDCGIRPSPKASAGLAADQLPALSLLESGSGKLDAVLVTHAHTDHTGALELVLERYPDTPVYATPPSMALTRVLHQDSRRIMQNRLEEEGELPLFDDVATQRLMAAMVPVPFHQRLAITGNLAVTFFPAGHILGAAMLGLESDEGRLLISGDISISPQRTVDGARPPSFRPDFFVVESTYGGRLHANRAVQERKLVETIAQVTGAGGKVLIPAFALGRAQEVLLILGEYLRRGELPAVPVWADGMVRAICQVYPMFSDALPLALQELTSRIGGPGEQKKDRPAYANPFFTGSIRPVTSNDQRNAILWEPGPAVIVSSSGMLAGGPSLSYARALAGKPEHAILLTGYQDEESPGRRLQELSERGSGSLRLGADKVDVQCRIASYSLSAHADESQIINFTGTLAPEHVFLVHGDGAARASLERALRERHKIVHLPKAGQTVELGPRTPVTPVKSVPDSSGDLRSRQGQINYQRREAMGQFTHAAGKWIVVKGEEAAPARCLAIESDHLWVEIAPGLEQAVYPEAVLAVLDVEPPSAEDLAPYLPSKEVVQYLEPNQALAAANHHFPPEACLRKSGYRLAERTLTLTFDFPDAAREQFADLIADLARITGWKVEVTPEANQAALNAVAREVLPEGWKISKGPAIYLDQKRVSATVAPVIAGQTIAVINAMEACERFRAITDWELTLVEAARPVSSPAPVAEPGKRMEINTAYGVIKTALEGSTLYRTSLKGDEIIMSFISPQVAERYRAKIQELARQTGWALGIHPQPNQGAILEAARSLLAKAELAAAKGPSIYPNKAEVSATLTTGVSEEVEAEITRSFEEQTGYHLVLHAPVTNPANTMSLPAAGIIEIPINRIRLSGYHQTLNLDAGKLEKAVERARQMGITPPIQVRRAQDGYILSDGLYRLRAAEALGLERVPVVVEA